MAVHGLGRTDYHYVNYTGPKAKGSAKDEDGAKTVNEEAETAAAETKTAAEETNTAAVTKQKSETYKPDMDKIREMKSNLKNNMGTFKQMVATLFKDQSGFASNAMKALLNIDSDTQASAQAAISEDGEWGVNATANRILEFAKALSGGDPDKIETLKDAVTKGFKAAEKVWGGKLPGISYDTLQKVMDGFDEWAKAGKAEE